jgi:hypothetical protein
MAAPKEYVYDEHKFRELVLYVCERAADDPLFGKTKLLKVLFLSDFLHYARHAKPITGARYMHLPHGPVPRKYDRILLRMAKDGDLREEPSVIGGMIQERQRALRPANTTIFSGDEIALVDEVITRLRRWTASALSDQLHKQDGWRVTQDGEEIPYFTVCLPNGEIDISEDDLAFGQQLAAELGPIG